jgi:hypothetical protein
MDPIPTNLVFEYAIQFPDGQFFLGPSYEIKPGVPFVKQKRINDPASRGPKEHAYTYTERRAHNVIRDDSLVFLGAKVVRVL